MKKKYIVLGIVSVLLLTSFAGLIGTNGSIISKMGRNGETHLYLIYGENSAGKILRDYGKMKLVMASEFEMKNSKEYFVNVDYMKNIGIWNMKFDPLKNYPKIPGIFEKETSKYYIVQFDSPVRGEDYENLREMGKIISYLPYNAYIIKLEKPMDSLKNIPHVRWYGVYQPYFKVSNELYEEYLKNRGIRENKGIQTTMETNYIPVRIELWTERYMEIKELKMPHVFMFGHREILTGYLPAGDIPKIAAIDNVLYMEKYVNPRLMDEKSAEIIGGAYSGWGAWIHTHLLNGEGIIVAVADTGIDTGSGGIVHPDLKDRVIAFWSASGDDAHDGYGHGTHVSGIIAGTAATGEKDADGYLYGLGVAPHAHLVEEKIFSDSGSWLSPNPVDLGVFAQSNGAIISSNSWGAAVNGAYDDFSQIYDNLTRDSNPYLNGSQEILYVFAAGNSGSGAGTVGSPGTGKNVLTVGANENDRFGNNHENIASFSSRGPAADGRLKPDVVAPGTWISSALSQDAHPGWAWGNIDQWYEWCGGTSQATPHVAGSAAIFAQYYEGIYGKVPSPALIKAALINSAIDLNGTDATQPIPNNNEGWGMVYLPNIIDPPYGESFIDQNVTLQTGQSYSFNVSVVDTSHPLKITMDYTDKEAAVNANPTLVNDLNLIVHDPNGNVYIGNNFANGWTQQGNAQADALNNTENVYIQNPIKGNYTIEVYAQNVPSDAVPSTPQIDQDFAIAITGGIGNAIHYSAVRFSKNYYKPGDNLNPYVLDSYANTNPYDQDFVSCDFYSQSTGDHEKLTLMETGDNEGVFNASIPTEIGNANPGDGILQISSMDIVKAQYKDYLGSYRYASTNIDGTPPSITAVYVDNIHSTSAKIHVSTSEDTSIKIYYGTTGHLENVTQEGYSQSHSLTINGLEPYTQYYFDVYVEDKAGNGVYDDNNSNHYSFRTAIPPNILLVADEPGYSSYSTGFIAQELDDLGYDYTLWDTGQSGSPSYGVLSSYPIVIWNTGPDWSSNTLTSKDQTNLENYMDSGGRLILMGQDIIWGIGLAQIFTKYFHISSVSQDAITGSTTTVYGVSGNPITGNYTSGLSLDSTYYLYIDELTTDGSSEVSNLFMDTNSKPIGVMVDNTTYRGIFMAFPYECLAVDEYPAAKNITYNMLKWILPGKDVYSLYSEGNDWVIPGENYTLNVLISNKDTVSHTTDVHFYAENSTGAIVYSDVKTVNLNPSSGSWIDFTWNNIPYEDIFTLHVYVKNETGEGVLINNNISRTLYARNLLGTINVVGIDSWAIDYSQYSDLSDIENSWYKYGDYMIHFDVNSLNKEDFTINDILNAHPDVLFISNAWSSGYGWEFTDSEINAIKTAVAMGYGIISTSGTFDATHAPNNMKLAPVFGLNESIGGVWADTVSQYTVLNTSHPIFKGLPSTFAPGFSYACVGLVPEGATVLAQTDAGSSTGKVGNLTEYKYGGGEALYVPTMVEYTGANDYDRLLFYNMLTYTYENSTPIPYDIAAINITTDKEWVETGNEINVTVNIYNSGTHYNTGTIKLYGIYENGTSTLIGSASVNIASHTFASHTFSFTPQAEGKIILKGVIISPNDMVPEDNITYGYTYSRIPRGTILVAGVDSLGSAYPSIMVWSDLKNNWYKYGNYTLEFDMGTLNGKNITYGDINRSKADVLFISDAWNNYPSSGIWWEFSDSEIAAIKQYVSEGHGLIMTSGTLSVDDVPNNMKLAPMAGLNSSASQHWATTFSGTFNLNMSYPESQYIFKGITNPYECGLVYTAYNWALNSSDPADEIANSTDNYAGIFFHKYQLGSVIYFSHLPEYAANANPSDKQLVYNSIVFTYKNSTQPIVDNTKPKVKFVNPQNGQLVSGTISIGINATDDKSWITNVTVYLVNSSANISYSTIHDYNLGVFKTSIDTTGISDGSYDLIAKAVDYYGNVNYTKISITVDNTNPVVAITAPMDNAIIIGMNVTVNWSYTEIHIDHFEIEMDGGSWINVGTNLSYNFTNLQEGEHTVVVRGIDTLGNIGSNGVTFKVSYNPVPSAPQNLQAIVGWGYVNLTWLPPADNGGSAIVQYNIYRGVSSGGEVLIATVSGTQTYYNDTSVSGGTTYYYYVTAVNSNGEGYSSNEVSNTPPALTITPVSPVGWTNSSEPIITAHWNDAQTTVFPYYNITIDGIYLPHERIKIVNDTSQSGYIYGYLTYLLTNGNHTIFVEMKDSNGNYANNSWDFRVDAIPPTLEITSPSQNDIISTSDVTVSWSGSDSGSGIDHYEIRIDGGTWINAGTASQYTFTSVNDGTHTVDVKAVDVAGNNVTDSVSFTVDTTAPTLIITSPANAAVLSNSDVTVSWSGSDSGSGIDHYEIRIDGGTWINAGTASQYTFTSVNDGTHTVDVKAVDVAGNNVTDSVSFTVDTTAPTLIITSPANGNLPLTYNKVMWINGTTDPDATVTINGTSVAVDSNGNFTYQTILVEGYNKFVVISSDSAGNSVSEVVSALYLPQLPELWENITNLQSEINNLQDEINNLQNEINNLQNEINNLNATLQSEISNLQDEINNLQSQLTALQSSLDENVTALNKAIEDAKTDLISRINHNVSVLNGKINDVKGDISNIKDEIGHINAKNTEQDNGISANSGIGITAMILGIIALIIAILNLVMSLKKKKEEGTLPQKKENIEAEEDTMEEY